jgi:hypothetical protein
MVSLNVVPYIGSKVFIGFLFAAYSAFAFYLLSYIAVDLTYLSPAERLELFVPVLLSTFSGVMLGLLVSAISTSEERAMLLIIGVIIPQFLLSGGLLPIKDFGGVGPLLTMPATSKWALGALVTTAEIKTGPCEAADLSDCRIPGIDARETPPEKQALLQSLEKNGDIFDVNVMMYWGAMLLLITIILIGIFVLQKRKDPT